MLVLFDHGTPRGITRALPLHTVKEAKAQGWDTLTNGELLKVAEEAGFEYERRDWACGSQHHLRAENIGDAGRLRCDVPKVEGLFATPASPPFLS